jgi:Cu(I)/Ag(I) efflux system membrane fusion protein
VLDARGRTPLGAKVVNDGCPALTTIVVSKLALRGAQVNPGDQLFSLATLERVWINADIYEDDVARVQTGQRLEAVTAAYPDETFEGVVNRISPALDPNVHTLQLLCEIQNPGGSAGPSRDASGFSSGGSADRAGL